MSRRFDLNLEKILDNWEVYHAVREIIANALDEKTLTRTQDISIFKDSSGKWHIRDYGRGLKYSHLTQNENDEKKRSKDVIGKFGVGLKDALAVLYKNKCYVQILSRYGDISLAMCQKEGFSDTITLHAVIDNPSDPSRIGTEFILGVSDKDMEDAKALFLVFSNRMPLDTTSQGEIYRRSKPDMAYVYVHGVKVAEEPTYMFDYNITKTNTTLEKSLNRERSAVSRSAYSNIVMKMLLNAKSDTVAGMLVDELKKVPLGESHDEITRVDIQVHAIKIYNQNREVVFIPASKSFMMTNDDKEKIAESHREVVIVPDSAFEKVQHSADYTGGEIGTFETVLRDYSMNFVYNFVDIKSLSTKERSVFDLYPFVFDLYGNSKYRNRIRISENINELISGDTLGAYDPKLDCIIIKRSVLSSRAKYLEVLFHELVHATTSYPDNDRRFENELGKIIGILSDKMLLERSNARKDDESRTTQNPVAPAINKTVTPEPSRKNSIDLSENTRVNRVDDEVPVQKKRHGLFGRLR